MVRYDRTIPPGGEGTVSLKIKTEGLSGNIRKTARVYSNDPKKGLVTLSLEAFVKVAIHVLPRRVSLYGDEGEVISNSVRITAKEEKPLELEPVHFDLTRKVDYRIDVVEPGKVYLIKFTNTHTRAGKSRGTLKLKTNYSEKPEISIPVNLKLRKKRIEEHRDGSGVSSPRKP